MAVKPPVPGAVAAEEVGTRGRSNSATLSPTIIRPIVTPFCVEADTELGVIKNELKVLDDMVVGSVAF